MQKFLIIFFVAAATFSTCAQTTARYDTIMLSVFNTGAKYRIAPAGFGADVKTLFSSGAFLGEMVLGVDTLHTWTTKTCDSCKQRNSYKQLKVSHGCAQISGDVAGKVAVIDMGKCTDATDMAVSAQKRGAKAVVFIHLSDDRDKIEIKEGARKSEITIPVFTVRNTTGNKIGAMLPSKVAIAQPKILVPDIQQLAVQNRTEAQRLQDSIAQAQAQNSTLGNNSIRFAPNPSDDVLYLRYNYEQATELTVSFNTLSGQTLYVTKFTAQGAGEYEINTQAWITGDYVVSIQRKGAQPSYQKFVISR